MAASRTPEIVADSAYEILRKPPAAASGNTYLDDEVLGDLVLDLFVADWLEG